MTTKHEKPAKIVKYTTVHTPIRVPMLSAPSVGDLRGRHHSQPDFTGISQVSLTVAVIHNQLSDTIRSHHSLPDFTRIVHRYHSQLQWIIHKDITRSHHSQPSFAFIQNKSSQAFTASFQFTASFHRHHSQSFILTIISVILTSPQKLKPPLHFRAL